MNDTVKIETRCKVCLHEDRDMIDQQLLVSGISRKEVAERVGCSRRSVSRHIANHLVPNATQLVAFDPEMEVDILLEVRKLISTMRQHADQASREGSQNWQAIRALNAELRSELELLAKLFVLLSPPDNSVALASSDEWVSVRSDLLSALIPYPDARAAVLSALSRHIAHVTILD